MGCLRKIWLPWAQWRVRSRRALRAEEERKVLIRENQRVIERAKVLEHIAHARLGAKSRVCVVRQYVTPDDFADFIDEIAREVGCTFSVRRRESAVLFFGGEP